MLSTIDADLLGVAGLLEIDLGPGPAHVSADAAELLSPR